MANNLIDIDAPPSGGVFHATKTLADAAQLQRSLTRIAYEIDEANKGLENVVLVGIETGGVPIAAILQSKLNEIAGINVPLINLDVTGFRDDLTSSSKPQLIAETKDRTVVVVDDVLFTGRTVRAALNALSQPANRPATIQLAVAVDRGHRELPIRPDYVGKNYPTQRAEHIEVDVQSGILLGTITKKKEGI